MPEERKLVTVLFADVTGSTALGESLDPEDVRALMGRYYAHARRVVANHGGTLEKFIGDAVMAVFGLPQAHGDDAERALAAALALREAVAADEILGEGFQLRMGVNTGEVVATSDPSGGDFLVTGDAVNVAARLQQHASPGEIVAGERTASASQTSFLFDEARMIEVKGKKQPLRVFPLKEAQTVRKVNRPPFVGRKQDLMQLQLLQARILEEQRPQLVSIVAPAGTGKTRLLEEFLKRLDPDDGFQVAMVRCLPYGQTLTYWPLRGLLDGLLQGEEISKAQVVSVFAQGGYKQEDAAHLTDLVLSALGIEGEGPGTTDRESIFTAWRLLIEVFAQQAPRILVFEDLHWASDSMLDLVEHVINMRTHAPLLLAVLSRPELLDRRPAWGGGRQNFTALALQPLNATQTQELLKKLTEDLPETTRQQIGERCGGNPFFALELVRGLAERELRGAAATLDVLPDTVHAAVLARLDLLSKQERAVLQIASVGGRGIRSPMLREVLDNYSLQEIDTALDGLLQRDMLMPAEGSSFAFRYTLLREVAYGTLSRSERIRLHSKIATWLESIAGEHLDEYAELIAYHYREAVLLGRQSAVPKAMPAETAKALHYLERAGELASRSGAFVEAKNYLENAIALAPEAEHLRLYEKLGDSLVWGDTVVEAYSNALQRWRVEGEQNALTGARLLRKLLSSYGRASKSPEQAELDTLWDQARQLAEQAADESELWRFRVAALGPLLQQALIRGSISETEAQEGLAVCREAAAFFEQQEDWYFLNTTLDFWASFLGTTGAHTDALAISRRRLAIPGIALHERGDATVNMTRTYFLLGDYEQCITIARETLAALHPGEPIEYFAGAVSLAMWATYVSGQWDEAPPLFSALGQIWERLQLRPGAGVLVFDGYLASLLLAKAREDGPIEDISASALGRMIPGDSDMEDFLSAIRSEDPSKLNMEHVSVGITGLILTFFSEANLQAPQKLMQGSFFQNDMTTWCVKIAQALSDNDEAQLASAIDEAEAHQLIVHAARMRVILAQRAGDRTQLERARPVLEKIGDRHFLQKLARVEAELVNH